VLTFADRKVGETLRRKERVILNAPLVPVRQHVACQAALLAATFWGHIQNDRGREQSGIEVDFAPEELEYPFGGSNEVSIR
jgi:hypothetical protein